MEEWELEHDILTSWMRPFVEQGLAEVVHMSKADPGRSKCLVGEF